MSLSDLGEFGLIKRIIERLGEAAAHDILVPPGDDAAAWAHEGAITVATVDSLVEGTHWRRDTMSLADVGWRCAATSLSDLAAMGVGPGPLLIAAQLGPDVSLADLDAFVDGLAAACRCFGARIAGGNIARAASTSFSATAIGSARDGSALLRRDAARPGDTVAVSGAPGAAGAGLALIEAERESEPEAAPLIAAHRRPRARIALGRAAVAAGLRCAIDLSDGLLQDLGHVAAASGVAIEIEAAALPLHPAAVALLGGDRALALALGGGEDYELALCGPAATLDALAAGAASEAQLPPLTRIGRVVTGPPGEAIALDPSGRRIDPAFTGWDQLR